VFDETIQDFVPVETLYPLVEFTGTGEINPICPYFNCVYEGRNIPRAYRQMIEHTLSRDDTVIINKLVSTCPNAVAVESHLVLSERVRDILEAFCEKKQLRKTYRLVKNFLSFISQRDDKGDDPCKDVAPEEKKDCYNQRWIKQFEVYLESVGFRIPQKGKASRSTDKV